MSEPRYKNGYMLAVEQIARLTADLTTERARADALAVENAELRDGLARLVDGVVEFAEEDFAEDWNPLINARALLAADPAQRGAGLLAAADEMLTWLEQNGAHWSDCAFWDLDDARDCSCGRDGVMLTYRCLRGRPMEG